MLGLYEHFINYCHNHSFHLHSCNLGRIPHCRTQRADWLFKSVDIRFRVCWSAVGVLLWLRRHHARRCTHRSWPSSPSDGEYDRQAPCFGRCRTGLWGFNASSDELGLAELLRNLSSCYWCCHGCDWSHARNAGTRCLIKLRTSRIVPSRKESSRGELIVLWDVFKHWLFLQVYWRIYNALYLGAADSMVPFYPDLGELSEGQNVYDRHPLQMFI